MARSIHRRHAGSWLLLGLLLLATWGCGGGVTGASETADDPPGEEKPAGEGQEKAPPVQVVTLARGAIEATLTYSSDLEAEESVGVYSKAAQRITRLHVEEGDRVREGDLLAELEAVEQRNALDKAESQLRKAQRDFDRQQSLYQQELISEDDFSTVTYELEQKKIAVAEAERQLSYTGVRAPISGTVTARHVNVGDQLTVNQHLFDLVDFDSLVVRVYVPEKDLVRVRLGQEVRIRSQARPGTDYTGRVERVAPVVDPRTGTVKVTVDVPNQKGLLPGMFLEVEVVTDVVPDALLVPKRALVLDDDQAYVFRLTGEGKVERLEVLPVLEDAHRISVGEGLAAGDRVVVAGQAGLKPGDAVRVVGEPGSEDETPAATEAAG
jgi:membrane fusion protein (multidrug efflux system)